jgi:hypothetical protein
MKKSLQPVFLSLLAAVILLAFSNCKRGKIQKSDYQSTNDTIAAMPDTGYTGIKQFMSGKYLVSEVTFKNGIEEGLKKTFYMSGKLRQTFWYENGLREDSSKWYYEEGQVFRITPYVHDTINGTQTQYYRTGEVKAILKYRKGLRIPFLEEYTRDGKLITNYPSLVISTSDEYKTKGVYSIKLQLSNKSQKVRYYRGNYTDGLFDTAHLNKIHTVNGTGYLNLKKTSEPQAGYIDIIAEILTNFGNNYLLQKKIKLPYNDLN